MDRLMLTQGNTLAYSLQEAQRAVQALNPLERAVFALTRTVVSNKKARSAFILYTGALVCSPRHIDNWSNCHSWFRLCTAYPVTIPLIRTR